MTGAAFTTGKEAKPSNLPGLDTVTGMMSAASSKTPAAAVRFRPGRAMGHQDEGDDRADGAVLVLEGAPPLRVHREPDAHPGHCRGQDKEDAGRPAGPVPGQPRQRNRPRGNQPGCLPATGVGEGVAATVPEQKVLPYPSS